MSATASLFIFLKTCGEAHFLLWWTWCAWGHSAHSRLLPCPLPIPTGELWTLLSSSQLTSLALRCRWECWGCCPITASLAPWPQGSWLLPFLPILELSSRLIKAETLFSFSWNIYIFNFSEVLNKFPIIEANRCSLAGVLGLAWLQNHFEGAHSVWPCCLPRQNLCTTSSLNSIE